MKKIKSILSLSIVALCAFCVLGITKVYADPGANNFRVACEKDTLEKGDQTMCYILATVTNDPTTTDGINGLMAVINNKTKNLEVGDPLVAPAKSGVMYAERIASGQKIQKDSGASAASYTCEYDKCDMFYAKNGESLKAATKWSDNGISEITGFSAYTVLGAYQVKLSADATMTDCGKLCVDIKYSIKGDYSSGAFGSGGTVPCAEIKPEGESIDPPGSGSFTSYIVLIGGAFLALGAIALARKNNKFYRV